MLRRIFMVPLFVIAFVINPAYVMGCGGADDSEFTFDEADMLSLLETVNGRVWSWEAVEVEFSLAQGSEVIMTERVVEPSWLSVASACGNRSFVTSAGACVDISTLGVTGTMTIRDAATGDTLVDAAAVDGYMEVMGLNLSQASIFLTHDQGEISMGSDDGRAFELTEVSW